MIERHETGFWDEEHPVFTRNAMNYDRDEASLKTGLICNDEDLTQQQFKDETDINVLLRRFAVTGEMPEGVRMPTYEDFSDVDDFHTAANAIAVAREAFDAMPAEVRYRFRNDPGEFVAFCSDEGNRAEAEKLGLVPVKPPVAPLGPPPPRRRRRW